MSISGSTSYTTTTYYQPPGPPPVTPPAGLPEVAGTQRHLHGHPKPDGEPTSPDQVKSSTSATSGIDLQA
jgi:hypothetical protein